MVLRLLRALPGAPGVLATVTRATPKHQHECDTSVGVSGPRGLTVRGGIVRRHAQRTLQRHPRPSHLRPNVRDDRETPLLARSRRTKMWTWFARRGKARTPATYWPDGQTPFDSEQTVFARC